MKGMLHRNVFTKVQVHFPRTDKGSSNQVPRAMFLHLSLCLKRIVDSGASLHMMSKSDLTPEEQETIRKSKDPSVIMTGNGTTHTTEEGGNSRCL